MDGNKINAFYLKGNFNTNTIKQLSEKGEFDAFTTKLQLQPTNTIIPNTIQ
jgi:hypothetical protein